MQRLFLVAFVLHFYELNKITSETKRSSSMIKDLMINENISSFLINACKRYEKTLDAQNLKGDVSCEGN